MKNSEIKIILHAAIEAAQYISVENPDIPLSILNIWVDNKKVMMEILAYDKKIYIIVGDRFTHYAKEQEVLNFPKNNHIYNRELSDD